jgi:hypothetical protein
MLYAGIVSRPPSSAVSPDTPLPDSRKPAGAGPARGLRRRPIDASARLGPRGLPTALLKKEPVIGDGSQSREDLQGKSIRGSVMCRNSHTRRGNACGSSRMMSPGFVGC